MSGDIQGGPGKRDSGPGVLEVSVTPVCPACDNVLQYTINYYALCLCYLVPASDSFRMIEIASRKARFPFKGKTKK